MLLHVRPSHGYELAQALAQFGMDQVDASLVYRLLRQMEREGLIASEWQTDVSSGPARRVYHLTSLGESHLAGWAAQLRETDQVLHRFLGFYDRQMEEGEGGIH